MDVATIRRMFLLGWQVWLSSEGPRFQVFLLRSEAFDEPTRFCFPFFFRVGGVNGKILSVNLQKGY